MRCFVGIAVASDMVAMVAQVREAITFNDPAWSGEKWVRDENLHVTVRFLGELESHSVDALCARIDAVVADVPCFDLGVVGLRARRSNNRANLLLVELDDRTGGFETLTARVDDACGTADIEYDARPQAPHLTVCRARRPLRLRRDALAASNEVLAAQEVIVSVPSVSLFSSRLAPGGPQYRTVGTWRLRGE